MTIDLDALEAEYGDYAATEEVRTVLSLIAELRQERERAENGQARAALAVLEQAQTPTECLDCGRTDGGCDRVATGLKPHTAYTVRVNGSEPITLTTQGEPTDHATMIAATDRENGSER